MNDSTLISYTAWCPDTVRPAFILTMAAPPGTPAAQVIPFLQKEAQARLQSLNWVQGCEYVFHWEDVAKHSVTQAA